MNDTQTPPPPPPPPSSGPPPSDPPPDGRSGPRVSRAQMRDVDRLRRSVSDRKIAGVAGGLGRHFDVDPTLFRVLLAVLVFFGGAGLLLYVAVWLLVPEDGQDSAAISTSADTRRALLFVAVAMAALFFLGGSLSRLGGGFLGGDGAVVFPVLVLAALVGLAVWGTDRGRRHGHVTRSAGPPPAPGTYGAGSWSAAPVGDDTVPPAAPPTAVGTAPAPRRPRRTGLLLFWPTLAVVALALGGLGLYQAAGGDVAPGGFAALALAITGLALVLGTWVGRAGGLIALGVVLTGAMVISSVVGVIRPWERSARDTVTRPTSIAQVHDLRLPPGDHLVDLSALDDPEALEGRTLDIRSDVGRITVVLPDEVSTNVDADIRYAGGIKIGDGVSGGIGTHLDRVLPDRPSDTTDAGPPTTATPDRLELDVSMRAGQITVRN